MPRLKTEADLEHALYEIVASLPLEYRLAGLSPEERLAGLSPEEMEALRRMLQVDDPPAQAE